MQGLKAGIQILPYLILRKQRRHLFAIEAFCGFVGLYTENHEFALLAHRSKHRIIQKKINDPNIKNTGVVIPAFSNILPHDDFGEGIASQ